MNTYTAKLAAGWGWPDSAGKVHYFPEGEARSLCKKVQFTDQRVERDWAAPENCDLCKSRFKARKP